RSKLKHRPKIGRNRPDTLDIITGFSSNQSKGRSIEMVLVVWNVPVYPTLFPELAMKGTGIREQRQEGKASNTWSESGDSQKPPSFIQK
ncbi:hypothetical protein ACC675_37200, partial [Rhizobium ruizarguesonis]